MPFLPSQLINQILCGDAYRLLCELPDESIDCVVTSPPYWGLRDYGVAGQIGLEATAQEYLEKLGRVFAEIKRVLKPQGTCWVNLGDTYGGDSFVRHYSKQQFERSLANAQLRRHPHQATSLRKKCLAQIPARFALAMTSRGWLLRNEIIWWKPNCLPSSATDRFTVDFEKLFFFVKQRRYYFEQQYEPLRNPQRLTRRAMNPARQRKRGYGDPYIATMNPKTAEASRLKVLARGRNLRCVWRIATRGFTGAHFAVYPPELIEAPIQAGCPKGGLVLDPFMGSGTTALVAQKLGRNFVGLELNRKYVQLARRRLQKEGG